MKIEGVAGQAAHAQALGREQTPARPQDGGGKDGGPSVIVDITDAADQPMGTRGRSAMSPAHRARELMESYRAMGAEMGDLRFGQIVSRIARDLDASELFILPEPPADETPTGAPPVVEVEAEGGDEGGETPAPLATEPAPIPTAPTAPEIDPDLAIAAALLEDVVVAPTVPNLVVEPVPPAEDETA